MLKRNYIAGLEFRNTLRNSQAMIQTKQYTVAVIERLASESSVTKWQENTHIIDQQKNPAHMYDLQT